MQTLLFTTRLVRFYQNKGINYETYRKIYTPLPEKFGVPRQSGLVEELEGKIILDSPYNVKEAFDGIEEFSHLWILWQFSDSIRDEFSPTVRPPRLGGEKEKAFCHPFTV